MCGVLRLCNDVYTFQQVIDDVTVGVDTPEHLVQDGRFSHTIDAAEHVHVWVERPQNVFLSAPQ